MDQNNTEGQVTENQVETEDYSYDEDDKSNDWITDDVRAAMNFDPFMSTDEEVKTAQQPEAASSDGGQQAQPESVTQTQQETGGTPAVQPQAQPALTVEQLMAQNAELLNVVKSLQQPQVQPNQQQQQIQGQANGQHAHQVQPETLTQIPSYDFNIPDQLVNMLASEDPVERKQALAATVQGVATTVHQQVLQQVGTIVQHLQTTIPQQIAQAQQAAAVRQHVVSDFYGKYPQLDTPELRTVVQTIANQYFATNPPQWNATARDAIAAKVVQAIQGVVPTQPVQQPVVRWQCCWRTAGSTYRA
jgi:ribosomal 50S subunit-associated protein YjgA (DUF615 family)